jgi:hypothetical protein
MRSKGAIPAGIGRRISKNARKAFARRARHGLFGMPTRLLVDRIVKE